MSIDTVEFSRTDTAITAQPNPLIEPGKVIIGIDTTKSGCSRSKNLLNRVCSQSLPRTLLLNIDTAIDAARNINLVLNYDALIEIDPATSMVSARV